MQVEGGGVPLVSELAAGAELETVADQRLLLQDFAAVYISPQYRELQVREDVLAR